MNGHSGNSVVLLDLSLGLSNSETLYSFHCITAPQALWIHPEELQTGVCSPEALINRPENVLAKARVKDPDNSALCRLLALLWGVQSPSPAALQENAFEEATMHWAWAAEQWQKGKVFDFIQILLATAGLKCICEVPSLKEKQKV